MLMPGWQKKLIEAAQDQRELRIQQLGKRVKLIAVRPGADQMNLVEFISMAEYLKFSALIETFFEAAKGGEK